MKLTIDSTEALEDTLRVVGALYNVTLEVSDSPAGDTGSSTSSGAPLASTATSRAPRKARKARTAQKRKRPATRAGAAANGRGQVSTAAVRAWARENGYEIADRGRVPATVLTAYQQAGGA